MDYLVELREKGAKAKQAARQLAVLSTTVKNRALLQMADALEKRRDDILEANAVDIERGRQKKLSGALIDRLMLTEVRIRAMAEGLRQLADLADPIGQTLGGALRPNGLDIRQIRVPLGVVGMIYEARPNVTVDAAGLCLKSGNAVILRGGSEAITSNTIIARIIAYAAEQAGAPENSIQLIETTDRQAVNEMLRLNEYLDVIIPRGGAGLIRTVVENATVPVIETGNGVCHTFVDATADLAMASDIAFNAKVSRPGVCNSMETLLVHEAVASDFLPGMLERYAVAGVELRGCPETMKYYSAVKPATEEDWATEYHDLILSVRVVANLDAALEHIFRYGTRHSEAIVTSDLANANRFQREVDAACVYVNASTRFSDGFEFGFGAEIGISTQKLHARGPMGLNEMTSTKYLINGAGQTR
ncbi:gamma-glutamyl-phosphate reductase [Anaerosporomusa subterranea]|uniref:Gamma-glutamyl phosphate reductase n=1 Tax=Anaerosporomusa subterranea TaxID=1794912 RepID=A0A154BN16_ANASB|nr:glutamate-5-semialdehyde dehydrogenase [Anaerosporomusa subterranea]KYZ75383.1 gamma-glutamyl-phosphate reductase [Anaerosporomusa subterranea]